MKTKSLPDDGCSVSLALSEVGDWWSLMIIRNAMYGTRRFSDFQQQLGIARNILSERLERLVTNGILRRVNVAEQGRRFEYRLTDKGRDLFVVLTALRQWGDRWINHEQKLDLRDRASGRPIRQVKVLDGDGEPLRLHQVMVGPAHD